MGTNVDLQQLVAALGDAVVVCDPDGAIVLWNAAATRIFGFSEAEAIGANLDLIIPERQRGRHWEGYAQTMRSGITKYGTSLLKVPAIDKAGKRLSIAFSVTLINGTDSKPAAIAAVIRDESERFAEERALRARIAELEARAAGTPP